MLRLISNSIAACDGLQRRELLRIGGLSALATAGLPFLPRPLPAEEFSRPRLFPGKAKAVILLNLFGGPSHLDMFDLKPHAPKEVRGEFQPIASTQPDAIVCEHLPQMAARMHRAALIRTHSHPYNSHNPYNTLTGFSGGNDRENYFSKRTDHPSIGSVMQYAGLKSQGVPTYVGMPSYPGYSQSLRRAGPYGGYLGAQYDPVHTICSPQFARQFNQDGEFYNPANIPTGEPLLPSAGELPEITLNRMDRRRSLLDQFDSQLASLEATRQTTTMQHFQKEALELLTSPRLRNAFDLSQESDATRDRYGRNLYGASTLLARRLVESGVKFITVTTESKGVGHWDSHNNNFNLLKNGLLPILDQMYSALIDDLSERGLLDSTLVVTMGEMGRSPKVNGAAGRDHWPQCGFSLFTGGGAKAGVVLGKTDNIAAYPTDRPVSSGDLVATIYELLGIDSRLIVHDLTNRPNHVCHGGAPITEIMS